MTPADGPASVGTAAEWADAVWLAARIDEAERIRAPDDEGPDDEALDDAAPPRGSGAPAGPARDAPLPEVPESPGGQERTEAEDGPDLVSVHVGPGAAADGAVPVQAVATAPPEDRLDQAAVERALRPLAALEDAPEAVLDEEATARTAAATRRWLPRTRPARTRRFRLLSLREDSLTMRFHASVLDEFDRILDGRGIFADVRRFRCRPREDVPEEAPAEWSTAERAIAAADPGAVLLVATDGLSSEWRSGRFQRRLARWSARHLVALVNVHPRRQWERTWLDTRRARLDRPADDGRGGAVPTARLTARLTDPGERSPFLAPPAHGSFPVPVLAFPDALADFARFAAGQPVPGGFHTRVLPVRSDGKHTDDGPGAVEGPEESAEQAVGRFRAEASDTAFRLLRALAAVPISLPVIQAVRQAVVPEAGRPHIAEVMGGGLIRRASARRGASPSLVIESKARELLLSLGRRSETLKALAAWARSVRDEMPWVVAFEAALAAPSTGFTASIPDSSIPQARIVADSLRSVSGIHLRLATRLTCAIVPPERTSAAASRESPPTMTSADSEPTAPALLADADEPRNTEDVSAEVPAARTAVGDEGTGPGTGPSTPRYTTGDPLAAARSVPPVAAIRHDPSDPPPVWSPSIPQKNRSFVGRTEELEELHTRLVEGTTSILPEAVWGMGGVGKTQLAVEYLYRHQSDYDLVWWVPASSTGEMMRSLSDLARTLELPVGASPDQAVPAVLEALRRGTPYRKWLMVYDNADSPQMVNEYLPAGGPGRVLITSRNRDWERTTRAMEVDVFEREESRELIRLRRPDISDADADRVAEVLGHLPLAVEQAAVWLLQTDMNADDYLEAFEAESEALLNIPDLTEYGPVTAAWNLSLSHLEQKNPAALRLLQICAFLAPVPIPKRYFKAARGAELPPELRSILNSPVALSSAMRDIGQLSLARLDHREGSLTMHRLVQQSLRYRMSPEEREEARHQAHLMLASVDPEAPDTSAEWPVYAEMLPHARTAEVHDCAEPWVRTLAVNIAEFLAVWGDIQGSLNVAQRALEHWRPHVPETDPQVLGVAQVQIGNLRRFGRFTEAQEFNGRLRALLLEERGPLHEDTLTFGGLFSFGKRIEGDFYGAQELSREVWEGARRTLGPEDPTTLFLAQQYGVSLRHADRVEEALEIDRATYASYQSILGNDSPSTLNCGVAVGIDLFTSGRYREGEGWLRRQVDFADRMFGPGAVISQGPRGPHSVALYRAGRPEEAVEQARGVYEYFSTREGRVHLPSLRRATITYMLALYEAGRFDEASAVGEGLLEDHVALYGEHHPDTLALMSNWATVCRGAGRLAEARRLGEEAHTGLRGILGDGHSYVPVAALGLANTMAEQGDVDAAVDLDRDNLERAHRALGADHPVTLAAERNLLCGEAVLAGEEAAVRLEGLRARYTEMHGETHPVTLGLARGVREDKDIFTPAL
ncbi:FxSxx-COOH system tetratricopeptide repeat protein [Nocardiopsis sp. RSe5-2]|uniref:FxSxx-COOH system tetratricopeptide repeat protein n=1 Tax=Nocardiopsis endophytica TaxID=3018445 RepID=A0ABT4TY66_9ACTN|nr:FxSxx-COOH system tetratricopeptide repeat protein [Nocardiopsis endophytica]MDA2809639.1 FxSxx-COOH system tetratricopeptide repeat protein [Nocardiopsis endophytica]